MVKKKQTMRTRGRYLGRVEENDFANGAETLLELRGRELLWAFIGIIGNLNVLRELVSHNGGSGKKTERRKAEPC